MPPSVKSTSMNGGRGHEVPQLAMGLSSKHQVAPASRRWPSEKRAIDPLTSATTFEHNVEKVMPASFACSMLPVRVSPSALTSRTLLNVLVATDPESTKELVSVLEQR